MARMQDAFADRAAGPPLWFALAARALPLGLLAQFLSAGAALFRDGAFWELHAALGGALLLPALALACGAVFLRRLRGFGGWAGLILALYLTQVALAARGTALPLSFHPFNAALLLTASLILLAKIERRRARPLPDAARP